MEENILASFHHQHNPLQPPGILGPRLATGYSTMLASELMNMPLRQQQHRNNCLNPDMLGTTPGQRGHQTAEAEAIDKMYEDLHRYEKMMDEAAAASLDQEFKDDLELVNRWFLCRSDPERIAALYTLVQNVSQIQIRFLITVLQQRADTLGEMQSPAGQDKGPSPITVASSLVSTESQYELRKRHNFSPSRKGTRTNLGRRLSSTLTAPYDLRSRDLFVPLGDNLGQHDRLYKLALTVRDQIQTANGAVNTSVSSTTSPTTSTFLPRISSSNRTSLFGTEWSSNHASDREKWAFGSLSSNNNNSGNTNKWTSKRDIIKEEHQKEQHSIHKSMAVLDEAQARLRQPKAATPAQSAVDHLHHHHPSQPHIPIPSIGLNNINNTHPLATSTLVTPTTPMSSTSSPTTSKTPTATVITTSTLSPLPLPPPGLAAAAAVVTEKKLASSPQQPRSPQLQPTLQQQQQQQQQLPLPEHLEQDPQPKDLPPFGQFLSPPSVHFDTDNIDYLSDQSDSSNKDHTLTGAARRRKRSSAARALKDKVAAETIDFDLMKDVQNWLRSLRLHKYSPSFDGLAWQQVIQMTDEDMLMAGINTLGARRKLVKVFENVMNYCDEHDIEYKNITSVDPERPK